MNKHDSNTCSKSLDWVLFNRGGWGDVFIDYAYVCQFKDKFNVLFYGYDEYIPKFLKLQDNIEEVRHITPKTPIEYNNALVMASMDEEGEWIEEIKDEANIKEITVISSDRLNHTIRKINFKYPKKEFKVERPSLLFNPYSFQSVTHSDHAPLIPEILVWLVDQTDWNIILIGQEKFYHSYLGEQSFPLNITDEHKNLQNLVGKTESMMDVFHIAKQCEGIITTSNCLSIWSILASKPALVLMNKLCTYTADRKVLEFHRNWIDYKPNTMLNYDCNPQQFMETFRKWEKTL